ncbi:hypothetical protein F5141DRAFT_1061868 [Pisolithus sp. B1]|nr:hypothetical protein F5141DRAFT_1061868 [Pisolithus sp. B1]
MHEEFDEGWKVVGLLLVLVCPSLTSRVLWQGIRLSVLRWSIYGCPSNVPNSTTALSGNELCDIRTKTPTYGIPISYSLIGRFPMSPIPQSLTQPDLPPSLDDGTEARNSRWEFYHLPFYQNPDFISAAIIVGILLLLIIYRRISYVFFPPPCSPQPGCAPSAHPVVPYPTFAIVARDLTLVQRNSSLLAPSTDLTEHQLSGCNIGPPLRIRMGAISAHPTLLADIGKNLSLFTMASTLHLGMEILNGPPTDVRRFNHHPRTRPHRRRHTKARKIRDKGVFWLLWVSMSIYKLHEEARL